MHNIYKKNCSLIESIFPPASSVDLKYGDSSVHVTMVPNPSHLEVK